MRIKFLMKWRLALRKTVAIHRITAVRTQEIFQMFNRGQAQTKQISYFRVKRGESRIKRLSVSGDEGLENCFRLEIRSLKSLLSTKNQRAFPRVATQLTDKMHIFRRSCFSL